MDHGDAYSALRGQQQRPAEPTLHDMRLNNTATPQWAISGFNLPTHVGTANSADLDQKTDQMAAFDASEATTIQASTPHRYSVSHSDTTLSHLDGGRMIIRRISERLRNALRLLLVVTLVASWHPATLRAQDFDALAKRFAPTHYYTSNDACPGPDIVIYRGRLLKYQGVENPNYIGINYVMLYDRDCGPIVANGDTEPYMVFLHYDPTIGDWLFDGVSTTAHWGSICEFQDVGVTPNVFVQRDTHGNYTSTAKCAGQCAPLNGCDNVVRPQSFYNVANPFIDDLGVIYGPWSGETVWDNKPFCGSAHTTPCATTITPMLYLTHFIPASQPPESQACYDRCYADFRACERDCLGDPGCRQQCTDQWNGCNGFCRLINWDSGQ